MISIDNSVELMLQTYITLPKRITNLDITRKERDEICRNFPSLLDGIEKHAADKIIGLDLGEIEWFHRLRNELYHQGNGLTVERQKVEFYAELAKLLFENLFATTLKIDETVDMQNLGQFMGSWIEIEKLLTKIHGSPEGRPVPTNRAVHKLLTEQKISSEEMLDFQELRKIRNEAVHGISDQNETISKAIVTAAGAWVEKLGYILNAL